MQSCDKKDEMYLIILCAIIVCIMLSYTRGLLLTSNFGENCCLNAASTYTRADSFLNHHCNIFTLFETPFMPRYRRYTTGTYGFDKASKQRWKIPSYGCGLFKQQKQSLTALFVLLLE